MDQPIVEILEVDDIEYLVNETDTNSNVDLTYVEAYLEETLHTVQNMYYMNLCTVGITTSVLVCVLIYKFIKLFY